MDLASLYEEVILDHNRNPRNYPERPADTNRSAHGDNPLCGDEVQVHMHVADGTIAEIGFEGRGCAICMASASLMTEAIKGKSAQEAQAIFASMHALFTGEDSPDGADLGKLEALSGVKAFPMRVKCASLAWHTMQAALNDGDESVSTE